MSKNKTYYHIDNRYERFANSLWDMGIPLTNVRNSTPEKFKMTPQGSYDTVQHDPAVAVAFLCSIQDKMCPNSKQGDEIAGVGTVVASGINGTTIKLPPGHPINLVNILRRGTNQVVRTRRIYASDSYLAKVQVCRSIDSESDKIREDQIHKHVAESSVTVRGRSVKGTDIVPEFIMGATVAHAGLVCRVSLMGMVDATPAAEQVLSAETVVRIEQALLSLWYFGISHSDLHFNNILVDKRGRPTIIDLGYAVQMPPRLVTWMRRLIERAAPEDEVWPLYNKLYLPYASIVLLNRGFRGSNPDTAVLRTYLDLYDTRSIARARRRFAV